MSKQFLTKVHPWKKIIQENPKTQVKNTAAEMRRPGEKQEAQPYSRSQKYLDRDN